MRCKSICFNLQVQVITGVMLHISKQLGAVRVPVSSLFNGCCKSTGVKSILTGVVRVLVSSLFNGCCKSTLLSLLSKLALLHLQVSTVFNMFLGQSVL